MLNEELSVRLQKGYGKQEGITGFVPARHLAKESL